jgi:two-component system OmpR family response regulator
MRTLIVEDDAKISRDLSHALKAAGFLVETSGDGAAAWFRGGTESYDLIILDLGLPNMPGLEVLARWREEGIETPVLVLTAKGSWVERVEGINAGADDYLPKPFRIEELIARSRALVRRSAGRGTSRQVVGRLELQMGQMKIFLDGTEVSLTPLEYRLMSYMIVQSGRTLSASALLEHLYGSGNPREANALEAIMARLRRKLGPDLIRTRKGFGYELGLGS